MTDQRVGAAFRAVRIRRGWRQIDVAARAGLSHSAISLIERGHVGGVTLDTLRAIASVLDIRLDVVPRWRGGELDRLLNARHSALGEGVTRFLSTLRWQLAGEVSFAISGERGWIDLLAWHVPTRTLLVIELKTEIVDVQELIGIVDRKTRLAWRIARDRGWDPAVVATWVVIAEGATNRRRVAAHAALLRTAFPADGRALGAWLRKPQGQLAALTFFANASGRDARSGFSARKRVRRPSQGVA